jgi:hypothetical protein
VILRSRVRDCLFLNWALPAAELPAPPRPLRYETHRAEGSDWVFASALLFRQEGLHIPSAAWARLSYPQLNLRFYTIDGDDVPSVLFHRMWVPRWVVPAARWIGRQTAHAATLDYPRDGEAGDGRRAWRARSSGELVAWAAAGSVSLGTGPSLGGWDATVHYFRQRPRGYACGPAGLRRVETSHVSTSVAPMEVEIECLDLFDGCLELSGDWPALHSAWLCPHLTFEFERSPEKENALGRQVPAPG